MTQPSVPARLDSPPPTRRKRWPWVLLTLGVALIALVVWDYWPVDSPITVGPDTTFITGPFNPDGTVNYVQYVIDRYSEGVTPDNNGARQIIMAVGPGMFGEDDRPAALQQLGLTEADMTGPFLRGFLDFCESHADTDDDEAPDLYDIRGRITSGPWTAEQFPVAADWLAANERPLALAVAASTQPHIYFPIIPSSDPPNMIEIILPSLMTLRELSRGLAARAMLRLGEGDTRGAHEDLMAVHRLARRNMVSPSLIQWLVGLAIESLASTGDRVMLASGTLTDRQIRAALADWRALPPLAGPADAMEGERLFALDAVMLIYRAGMGGVARLFSDDGNAPAWATWGAATGIDWDEMLRTVNHWWGRMAEAQTASTYPESRRRMAECEAAIQETLHDGQVWSVVKIGLYRFGGRLTRKAYTRGMTRLLMSILIPSLSKSRALHETAETRAGLNRLTAAAMLYRAKHGEYPVELRELTPEYLPAIPLDRFSDQPLKYERTMGFGCTAWA